MTFDNWISLAQVLVPVALAGVAYFLRGLHTEVEKVGDRVGGVEEEMRTLNGRLVRMEEWRTLHERTDEQRDDRAVEALHEVRSDVRNVRDLVTRHFAEQVRRAATG